VEAAAGIVVLGIADITKSGPSEKRFLGRVLSRKLNLMDQDIATRQSGTIAEIPLDALK